MNPEIAQNYTGLIETLRTRLESEEFLKRHRKSKKDFIRKRYLTFACMILMLINMMKRSLQDELDEFYKALNKEKVPSRFVTKNAFSQARKKLKASAFVELNEEQVTYFYQNFKPKSWFGYRLTAIHGTLLDVPDNPETRKKFGVWGSRHDGKGTPKARVSELFDVLNEVTINAQIAPKCIGERRLALRHLPCLTLEDLVLIDRGYPAFWFFAAIRKQEAHFCARLDGTNWDIAKEFIKSKKREKVFVLSPSADAIKTCNSYGFSTDPLTLRLIRVDLPSGEVEVLITSLLDSLAFSFALFANLYHLRWPVEEDYKRFQSRFEIENWSGLSPDSVYQDFHATIFSKNLAAILAHPAQDVIDLLHIDHKHDYKTNMTNLISKLKDTVVFLFWDHSILPLLQALWEQIIRTTEPIRPNRSFPRNKKVKRRRFPTNYKSTR